jgi:glucose/arabinose dehydrogenase
LTTTPIASGLHTPVYVTAPPNDPDRLFVVERSGNIRIVDSNSGQVREQPFATFDDLSTDTERGLLGLAFHPQYAENGLFYTYHSNAAGDIVLQSMQTSEDSNRADPNSAQTLLTVPHAEVFHYGGWLGFGPNDGYLYITTGDPDSTAQEGKSLFGKVLRIDVNADDFPDDPLRNYAIPASNPFVADEQMASEVFAFGLRNPWRAGFDRATGDLYLGDVGENTYEELDIIPHGSSGQNFGWPFMEANTNRGIGPIAGLDLTGPDLQYDHTDEFGYAITGGNVYRGDHIGGGLQGTYFFGDFITGKLWSLRYADGQVTDLVDRTAELQPFDGSLLQNPAGFGEDALGRIYIADFSLGNLFRIDAVPALADADRNGVVDLGDFGILKSFFGTGSKWEQGDFNGDGAVDLTDFGILKDYFGTMSSHSSRMPTPEPSTLSLGGLALLGLAVEWRRSRLDS